MERTVIVGGGEAGLIAAAYLERAAETDVVLVSEQEDHVFSFLLYDVLRGAPFSRACLDLRRTFRDRDVTVVRGLVQGLDSSRNRVDLRSGSVEFDSLLVAVGGVTEYDVDDRSQVADVRMDAREIRSAVNSPDPTDVVEVGGGPVGVETTATLAAVDGTDATPVTASHRLLPDFPTRASRIVERELRRRDVDLRTGARVTAVREDGVVVGGEREEPSDLTVWAGGVRPNPVIENFALARNERGLVVDSHLRCRGTGDVFAAGDVVDYQGKVKDGYSAGLEARTAAKNVVRGLRGQQLTTHAVRWHPRVVHLGRTALLAVDGTVHHGRWPELLREFAVRCYPFYWRRAY